MTAGMGKAGGYRNLVVWQKAMDLAEEVYRATSRRPKEEQYGLTNQVRRAAVSISANIAEGQGRTGSQELLHFLSIANGSLHEVETHLLLSARLQHLDEQACTELLRQTAEVGRLTGGLKRSLTTAQARPDQEG